MSLRSAKRRTGGYRKTTVAGSHGAGVADFRVKTRLLTERTDCERPPLMEQVPPQTGHFGEGWSPVALAGRPAEDPLMRVLPGRRVPAGLRPYGHLRLPQREVRGAPSRVHRCLQRPRRCA